MPAAPRRAAGTRRETTVEADLCPPRRLFLQRPRVANGFSRWGYVRRLIVSSATEFATAVRDYPFLDLAFEPAAAEHAAKTLRDVGLLLVGEPHGVRETPSVIYGLAAALDTRAVALEWSHEEMDDALQEFMRTGSIDFDALWALPASAEFFCGDGRIAAGHFALLERLRRESRLDQVLAFDRLDTQPSGDDWRARDKDMAERLLAQWDRRLPLLVLVGAFHTQLDSPEGAPMAAHLARELGEPHAAVLDYASGTCWWRGEVHDVPGAMPAAPITLRLPRATPADVPGPAPQR